MKKLTVLFSILVFVALLLSACGGGTGTTGDTAPNVAEGETCDVKNLALYEPGKLTVATGEPVFEPWMVNDDPTNAQGYESAFVYALAKEMGFAAEDVKWVRTTFDEAISPVEKPYDFNIQQYSITEERDKVVDFSDPYYTVQQAVVVLADSPVANAKTLADLRQAKFGAMVGTTDLDTIEKVIGAKDVAVYNTVADVLTAMNAGQVDATVIALPSAYYFVAEPLDNGKIVGILPGEIDEDFGMLFTDGSKLLPCVNKALQTLKDNGTMDELVVKWLQAGGDIPTIDK
ncbi:MAG: amino acid ABC transporter substrate-binding protein [Anaerolineales bacterium]|nr:MAG: amino acid ABC transporter substrate-binding protein [Anaerolineales bacterium]